MKTTSIMGGKVETPTDVNNEEELKTPPESFEDIQEATGQEWEITDTSEKKEVNEKM